MKVLHLLATGNNGGIESLVAAYERFSSVDNVYVFAWNTGICGARLKQSGAKVYLLQSAQKGSISKILEIMKICRAEKPDVVVVQHRSSVLRLASVYLLPYNVHIYQHYIYEKPDSIGNISSQINRIIDKLTFAAANGVIAISDAAAKSLYENLCLTEKKATLIYNGVNLQAFRSQPHKFDGTTHFCFVGRVSEVKGIQIMLYALSKLPKELNWDYTVIGDGPYLDTAKQICYQLQLQDRVTFAGNSDHVSEEIKKYDIFVHSCICEEGFGIGVVEAMAAGKLCIATASGGLPEIIENNVDGFLFKKGDVEALAEILSKCIAHPESWEKIQKRAMQKAESFGIERYAHDFEDYLRFAAEKKGR